MKLNDGKPGSHYEVLFATILDAFAVDYACQVTFHDYWLDHIGVGPFRVDFVIYDCGIVFEIDGDAHTSWRKRRTDRMKDQFLKQQNLRVVRITNAEIEADYEAVASRVYALVYIDELQEPRVRRRIARKKRKRAPA